MLWCSGDRCLKNSRNLDFQTEGGSEVVGKVPAGLCKTKNSANCMFSNYEAVEPDVLCLVGLGGGPRIRQERSPERCLPHGRGRGEGGA